MLSGRRRCEYFSATSALLAHVFRSNTNLQCNYRLPITALTHDRDCRKESCISELGSRRLVIIAQRAMKQMTGYFGGYISKKQKMGRFELKKSASALPLMDEKLKGRNLTSGSAQLAHITNRCFSVLESKGILRTATEEFLLASRFKPRDELAAEFIRTFRHTFFHGKYFVDRYDAAKRGDTLVKMTIRIPKAGAKRVVTDHVAIYGFRSTHPDMFFLSPWEFVQWFKPHALEAPRANYRLTKWMPGRGPNSSARKDKWTDYALDEDFVRDDVYIESSSHLYAFEHVVSCEPHISKAQYTKFRNAWVLIKRNRPVVPCPEVTPLPSRKLTKEARAKLCSIYLRPWTFFSELASAHVPLLTDLDLTQSQWLAAYSPEAPVAIEKKQKTSHIDEDDVAAVHPENKNIRQAWKDYLHRVPETAARQIRNFLLATLAEGRNHEDEDAETKIKGESVSCDLNAQEVQQILANRVARLNEGKSGKSDLGGQRLDNATYVAATLIDTQSLQEVPKPKSSQLHYAIKHARDFSLQNTEKPEGVLGTEASEEATKPEAMDSVSFPWLQKYQEWVVALRKAKKQPYAQQWLVLEMIHDRCVREFIETHQIPPDLAQEYLKTCLSSSTHVRVGKEWLREYLIPPQTSPVLKFTHGLPGSGKSTLLKWIRSYFEEVWGYRLNHQFVYLAPLNVMAANIDGATIHSWGEIGFCDRHGNYISSKSKSEDEVSTLAGLLDFPRWVFIDEIEACGAELLNSFDNWMQKKFHERAHI